MMESLVNPIYLRSSVVKKEFQNTLLAFQKHIIQAVFMLLTGLFARFSDG